LRCRQSIRKNLGSAVNPIFEGGSFSDPATRRLPVGNLINRLVGVALAYPFIQPMSDWLVRFEPDPARMTADFHLAFNAALALAFIAPAAGKCRAATSATGLRFTWISLSAIWTRPYPD